MRKISRRPSEELEEGEYSSETDTDEEQKEMQEEITQQKSEAEQDQWTGLNWD